MEISRNEFFSRVHFSDDVTHVDDIVIVASCEEIFIRRLALDQVIARKRV